VWDTTQNPDEEQAITFILPTRNRRNHVCRAIESCLRVHGAGWRVEVLVVDGHSTDGSWEMMTARYQNDTRVRLVRQQGASGFMPACFFSVPLVRTPWVTFMYDDDILSPHWRDLLEVMRRTRASFAMGFSVQGSIATEVPMSRARELRLVTPPFLLRAYCGCGHELSRHSLPFNPICACTRTECLHEWLEHLGRFTTGHPLRNHFMLQRNAGPDAMIYYYSIARHRGHIPVINAPVAQFSAHTDSMTSNFEPSDLLIGYWLARVWLCGHLRTQNRSVAAWCAAYTVKQGLRLILKRLRRRRTTWMASLVSEVAVLAGRSLLHPMLPAFVGYLFVQLLPRSWRPRSVLQPHREPLSP
jgi:hypothetical protein